MKTSLLLLSLLLFNCGKSGGGSGATGPSGSKGEPGKDAYSYYRVLDFAIANKISYGNFSTSPTQLDTLCVNLTGKDLNALQSQLTAVADAEGGDVSYYYEQYRLNDQDYSSNCLGSFPVTFTSLRTGETHTVVNHTQCRQVTSDDLATEYVNYLRSGGAPILLPAKIKSGGCSGASAPSNSRIQSVHGSMLSDFASIP